MMKISDVCSLDHNNFGFDRKEDGSFALVNRLCVRFARQHGGSDDGTS